MTTKEEKRIKKLLELAEAGGTDKDLAIFDQIEELEEKFEATVKDIKESAPDLKKIVENIKGVQGDKGEKGDKGDKGDRGDRGDVGKDGKNGRDGLDGVDGKDGADGKDGVDGNDGKDAELPNLEELAITTVNYIETLEGDDKLSMNAIKNLPETLEKVKQTVAQTVSVPPTTTHFYRDGIHFGRAKNIEFIHSKVEVVGDKGFITPITVSATPPADPFLYQLWLDIS